MNLFIEVRNGALMGQKFRLHEGLRIGRTVGEVQVQDNKMSSLHAQIEKNRDGELVLVDRGSSNGIWVGEERVETIAMMPGVVFRAGKTNFMVIQEAGVVIEGPPTGVQERRADWVKVLSEGVRTLMGEDAPNMSSVFPFREVVQLSFLSGPQTDKVVVIGYGPRRFGSSVLDIEITDPKAPFLAFEIYAANGYPHIVTTEHNLVLLNKQRLQPSPLTEGDIINIGETDIRVSFLK